MDNQNGPPLIKKKIYPSSPFNNKKNPNIAFINNSPQNEVLLASNNQNVFSDRSQNNFYPIQTEMRSIDNKNNIYRLANNNCRKINEDNFLINNNIDDNYINNINIIKSNKVNDSEQNQISSSKNENFTLNQIIQTFKNEILLKDEEIDGYKEKVKALLIQIKDKNNVLNRKNNTILKLNDEMEINNINNYKNIMNNTKQEIKYLNYQLKLSNEKNEKLKFDNKNIIDSLNKQIFLLKNEKQRLIQTISTTKEECKEKNDRIKSLMKAFSRKKQNNQVEESVKPPLSDSSLKQKNSVLDSKKFNYKDPLENLTSKFNFSLIKNKVINSLDDEIFRKLTNNKNRSNYDGLNDDKIIFDNDNYNDLLKSNEELKRKIKFIKETNDKNLLQKINEISQLNNLINDIKIKNEIELNKLKKENEDLNIKNNKIITDLKNKISNMNSEKNDCNENLVKELNIYKNSTQELEESLRDVKIEVVVKTRQIEELKSNLNSEKEEALNKGRQIEELNEDIESLKENNENIKKDNLEKTKQMEKLINDINEKEIKLKDLVEKNEEMKNKSLSIDKKNKELSSDNQKLYNDNVKLKNNLNTLNEEIDILKNENEKKIDQLERLNKELTEKNIKYEKNKDENENNNLQEKVNKLKNEIVEKEKEILNLKEASKAIIDKQKKDLEQKEKIDFVSPETHFIITSKKYSKLKWYLISKIDPKINNNEKNNYNNYKWVNDKIIPDKEIIKYNKFENDDEKINGLMKYIEKLNKDLEKKEEDKNKLDYKNKKLNEQLQNKSTSFKQGFLFSKVLGEEKNDKKGGNSKSYLSNDNGNSNKDIAKYKNLLEQLNDYGEREKKYQDQIIKLRNELKDKEDLQSCTKDINDIPKYTTDSGFFDEDEKVDNIFKADKKAENNFKVDKKVDNNLKDGKKFSLKFFKEHALGLESNFKDDKDDILEDNPRNVLDTDKVKGLDREVRNLKKDIKEKDEKFKSLVEQIKELFKGMKCDSKNKLQISQIFQILGYPPEVINKVINSKKGNIMDLIEKNSK